MKKRMIALLAGIILLFGCVPAVYADDGQITDAELEFTEAPMEGSGQDASGPVEDPASEILFAEDVPEEEYDQDKVSDDEDILTEEEIPDEQGSRIGEQTDSDILLDTNIASGTIENLSWSISEKGVLSVSGSGDIPDCKYSTASPWYPYRESITSIYISNGVTAIGNYAFYELEHAKTVRIPNSVAKIGDCAFYKLKLIKTVSIPQRVTTIGFSAFCLCEALEKVTVPGKVEEIGFGAFQNCSSLGSVALEQGVATIGGAAFSNCTSLKTITIPLSVTKITDGAFNNCTALEDIHYYGTRYQWTKIEFTPPANFYETVSFHYGRIDISRAAVTLSKKTYVYNGTARKPSVTVKLNKRTLKNGTDYTVTYSRNTNPGTATVTISGKADYKGTVKESFKIMPKAPVILAPVSKDGVLTVKWKKQTAQTSGFEIQYATNKSFKNGKKVTVSKASAKSKAIKNLKARQKYFVRIRAFKTISGKKWYSGWSSVKNTIFLSKGMEMYKGHFYKLYNTKTTWSQAKKKCISAGGHLVTITSAGEQGIVNRLLKKGNKNCYWLGARRIGSSPYKWKWLTGETFNSKSDSTYQNWAKGGNDYVNEDALMAYRVKNPHAKNDKNSDWLGKWNDIQNSGVFSTDTFFGSKNFGYICEWEKAL